MRGNTEPTKEHDACIRRSAAQFVCVSSVSQLTTQVFLLFLWQTVSLFAKYPGLPSLCELRSGCVTAKASEMWAEMTGVTSGQKVSSRGFSMSFIFAFVCGLGSEAETAWTELQLVHDRYLAWARKYIFVVIRHWHFLRSFVTQHNLMHPPATLSFYGWRKQTFGDI